LIELPSKTIEELESIFKPKSVAIIGASNKKGKVGYSVLSNVVSSNFSGEIYPINPKADEILGYKSYKSVSDVPNPIELAVICIPSKFVVNTIEECGKKGVKSCVIITAGFKEVGSEGARREIEVIELAKQYNMRVCGPNCLGVITDANFSFASITPKKGNIAMLSQSGAMMTGLLDWAVEQDIGFSAFISLGNKSDIDEVDFIEYLAQDPETKVIAAYIESVKDGEKFIRVVSAATKLKPIILLKSGRSAAGAKAASSHTGALAGSDIAFDLAFEKAGVIRADTISDLFNYALTFLISPIPKGDKYAIITNAGGPGIVCTDAMESEKVGLAHFSEETVKKLKEGLPAESNFHNPVDIIGDAPPERYAYALETLFKTPLTEVAGAIILLTPQAQTDPLKAAEMIAEIRGRYHDKILVASFIGGGTVREPAKILTKSGVPTYAFPEDAVKVVKGLEKYGKILTNPNILDKSVEHIEVNSARVTEIFDHARTDGRAVLLSHETSEVFDIYGIKNPTSRLSQTARDAAVIASEIGFPVVAKIVSPQIVHKWDVGGVILNIANPDEAREAFMSIMTNAQRLGPRNARIYGVEIQKMINKSEMKKVSELIIGMSRDPQWGPMLMVGSGGIYANYVKDVAFDLALKFDKENALNLLKKTKICRILEGVRGEPRSDIDGICDVLSRLAQLVTDFVDIVELDINPCLVFDEDAGYSAVDIKITISTLQK
jgi:acetate---CoA ligase (ADP-forming)